jgi:hypothetical protein
VHPDCRLAASDDVAVTANITPPKIDNQQETNMQAIDTFTYPIELSNEELDLVAAGCGGCRSGGYSNSGNNVGNNELIGVGDINVLSNNNVALFAGEQNSHG